MFSSVYQNGEYGIEIFAPSGNEPFKMCKLNNESNIKKVYDRSIKGYMAALEKESSTTFLQIPRSSKSSFGITQPLLVFQIQLHPEKSFTLELILLDSERQKRRFHLSTKFKDVDANNLHVCIPWVQPDREQWTNVAINLVDLIHSFSPPGSDVTYFGLESFSIQPVCRLRKIFTLPLKYLGDEDTGLLIPPKYDFTSGVEANSWVFNYSPPHNANAKAVQKDQETTHKASKHPTKTEGAKEGDLMGIVGKKVPRQEPNVTAPTGKTVVSATAAPKQDAQGTMHWAAEESALKRQKAVTGTSAAATPPPRNPWADSPAPVLPQASAPAAVQEKASFVSKIARSAPLKAQAESAMFKEDVKNADKHREFKIHSAKFTDEEEEGERLAAGEPMEVSQEHIAASVTVPAAEALQGLPCNLPSSPPHPTPLHATSEPAPAPPVKVVEVVGVPPGGIKFSSKLKQKLGGAAVPPVPTVPTPTTAESEVTTAQVLQPEMKATATEPELATVMPMPATAPALKAESSEPVNHSKEEGQHLEPQQKEPPQIEKHYAPPASPVLPVHPTQHQKSPIIAHSVDPNNHLSRMSVDDDGAALASQDFSAIDDFVKNYTTQQGALQGYASFARVDSEIATQLNSKIRASTPEDEIDGKNATSNDGIASLRGQNEDPFAQIKQHERTPSRSKKFADVALSPMPVMLSAPSNSVEQKDEPEKVERYPQHKSMHGIAEGTNTDEVDIVDVVHHVEKDVEEALLPTRMSVEVNSNRPPSAPAPPSRPSTANKVLPNTTLSRPTSATSKTNEELPIPPFSSPSHYSSRPPTAPSNHSEVHSAELPERLSSPARHSVSHDAHTESRPTTSTPRLSSKALDSALLSPYSDALAYFEQSKKSRDFSSSLRTSTVQDGDAGNVQNAEPNVSSAAQIDETQSYFDVYQQRSSSIAQQWTQGIDGLLEDLSHPSVHPPYSSSHSSSTPAHLASHPVSTTITGASGSENTSFASILSPSSLTTPLPERKKRAIRARVAGLLRQVEQAEMEYIAEFGFEAFEQEVGFFEEKTRFRRV